MKKRRLRVISIILAGLGAFLIFLSIYPIAEYEYVSRKRFPKLVSPITSGERYQILLTPVKDFSNINNWSAEYNVPEKSADESPEKYLLSVPKLGIKDALVFEGGEDLAKSLIQYPGTARPGQPGDAVIFGHSILPIFFNPKNYMSIFSTLPKLNIGDEIFVNIGQVMYKYKISEMFEVEPDNIDILDQRLRESYISLVTCVPPGHPLKPRRLVVRAKLAEI